MSIDDETALQMSAEIELLQAELEDEWRYNHWEHCGGGLSDGNVCGSKSGCHWPEPPVLRGVLTWPDFDKAPFLRRPGSRGTA